MTLKYELEHINCLFCGSSDYKSIIKAKDLVSKSGETFDVVRCLRCGLRWTNPRVKAQDIGKFYLENYSPFAISKATITFGSPQKCSAKNILVSGFHIPEDDYKGKKVLELGCSTGVFLQRIVEMGAKAEGIEFSEFAANTAKVKGLHVQVGTLESARVSDNYDYFFAWMVMEHVYDPMNELNRIYQLLKPGGKLVFSVPNLNSLDFKLFKKYWYALQVPTHITHYDKKIVLKMLDKAGFKVTLLVDHVTSANYTFSLKNFLNENGVTVFDGVINAFMTSKLFMPIRRGMDLLVRILGQSGRMTIWAEKKVG